MLIYNIHSKKQKQYWPYNASRWGPMLFCVPEQLVAELVECHICFKKKGQRVPLSVSISDTVTHPTHTLQGSRGSPRTVDRHYMYYINTPVSALFKHCYSAQKCT